jgi:homoserine/homoserine lactone efflux protein
MNFQLLVAFTATFASVLALPGPNSAFAVGQSLRYGAGMTLSVAVGFMLATGVHAAVVLSGLGVLISRYAQILAILKWCGVAYLVYLAIRAFRSDKSSLPVSSQAMTGTRMLLCAMAVSLTSPKALLASLLIYPLFVATSGAYHLQAAALILVAMLVSFFIYTSYIVAASRIRTHLKRSKWANKLASAFYPGAAGVLATK